MIDESREVRVLLVHDDEAERERLASGLTREGLRVLMAGTADEALRRFRAEAPHAVVLEGDAGPADEDDETGAFDVLALCRAVRERAGPGGAGLIVLGGSSDDASAAAAYAAGADSYVALPCAVPVLALRLRALVG